jgi:hypothetical protein
LRYIIWILLGLLGIIVAGFSISTCIRYCGCKPLTNVDDARADLEREIEKKPRRFDIQATPQHVIITPLPAGDEIKAQGGWFFRVLIGPEDARKTLYITNFGCSRMDIAIGP